MCFISGNDISMHGQHIDFCPEYKQTNSNITKGQHGILVIQAVLFVKKKMCGINEVSSNNGWW